VNCSHLFPKYIPKYQIWYADCNCLFLPRGFQVGSKAQQRYEDAEFPANFQCQLLSVMKYPYDWQSSIIQGKPILGHSLPKDHPKDELLTHISVLPRLNLCTELRVGWCLSTKRNPFLHIQIIFQRYNNYLKWDASKELCVVKELCIVFNRRASFCAYRLMSPSPPSLLRRHTVCQATFGG
jgi:hypothetical protein